MLVNKLLMFLLLLQPGDLSNTYSRINISYIRINDKLVLNEMKKRIRTEEISFSSPMIIGFIGGCGVLILAIIFLVWYCRKKGSTDSEQIVNQVEIKNKIENIIDINKEKLSIKELSMKDKEISIEIDHEKSNEIENNKPNNDNKENLQESASRNLMESHNLELKEKKLINLIQKYSDKLNDKFIPDHDKDEFFKPVSQSKSTKTDFASNTSKASKVSAHNINKENVQELVCYTNQRRDSPTISFYEKKMDEINHIKDIEIENIDIKTEKVKKNNNSSIIVLVPLDENQKIPCEEKVAVKEAEEKKIVLENKPPKEKKVILEKLKSHNKTEEEKKAIKKDEEVKKNIKDKEKEKEKEKEKKKQEGKKKSEDKRKNEKKNGIINLYPNEEVEEVEVDYYEEKFYDKKNLQPDIDDVISDFHERTKNIKIELFKKNTQDFDKESIERNLPKKKKKDLFLHIEAKMKS